MSCSPTMCMAGGAPTPPKTMNVSQLHDVMTIMHQRMLGNKEKSKEYAKTIIQIQSASKKLKNPVLKHYAQQTLFLEKQTIMRTMLVDMDHQIQRIILALKTFHEASDDFDEFGEEVDELYNDITDRYQYAFEIGQDLERLLLTFPPKQRNKIRTTLNAIELYSQLDKVYAIIRTEMKDGGDAIIDEHGNREFLFELLTLRRLLSSAIFKVALLNEIFEKPVVKSETKATPNKTSKKTSKRKSV
jgi:hypothetical protein